MRARTDIGITTNDLGAWKPVEDRQTDMTGMMPRNDQGVRIDATGVATNAATGEILGYDPELAPLMRGEHLPALLAESKTPPEGTHKRLELQISEKRKEKAHKSKPGRRQSGESGERKRAAKGI